MKQHLWKDNAACLGLENNLFFDKYEDDVNIRPMVDSVCASCPVRKTCDEAGDGVIKIASLKELSETM